MPSRPPTSLPSGSFLDLLLALSSKGIVAASGTSRVIRLAQLADGSPMDSLLGVLLSEYVRNPNPPGERNAEY
ncbi:hypothetical protein F5141DRAFT_662023 [Pisolithus sp. B1]|nr:hypothetical protein F5141DRAFT_662023 [Pisolithus sp. B1]